MKPQGYLARMAEDSEEEVVFLSNASTGRMEAYPAHLQSSPVKSDRTGKGPEAPDAAVDLVLRGGGPEGDASGYR